MLCTRVETGVQYSCRQHTTRVARQSFCTVGLILGVLCMGCEPRAAPPAGAGQANRHNDIERLERDLRSGKLDSGDEAILAYYFSEVLPTTQACFRSGTPALRTSVLRALLGHVTKRHAAQAEVELAVLGLQDQVVDNRALSLQVLAVEVARLKQCEVDGLVTPITASESMWIVSIPEPISIDPETNSADPTKVASPVSMSQLLKILKSGVENESDLRLRLVMSAILARCGTRRDSRYLIDFLELEPVRFLPSVPTSLQRERAQSILKSVHNRSTQSRYDWMRWLDEEGK